MGKRHTKQDKKQALGQYFTTKSDEILSGFEDVVHSKIVIDPFAGGYDLLHWALKNNASGIEGYDLDPKVEGCIQNDSLLNPPDYTGKVLVTNPPYLSSNKCKKDSPGKMLYKKWDQDDFYKCHLASLAVNGCEEAIVIIPSNFLCESHERARKTVFRDFYIVRARYWTEPVFDDATTGICVLHLKRGDLRPFECEILPNGIKHQMQLLPKNAYLDGEDFWKHVSNIPPIVVEKTDIAKQGKSQTPPNTNIIVGLLDHGKYRPGLTYNEGSPIYCGEKSFTTYQITTNITLSEKNQRKIVEKFNVRLDYFREKYHSMFLSNYMGANQKILSRSIIEKLFCATIRDLGIENSIEY